MLSTTDFLRAGLRQGAQATLRLRLWMDGQPFPIFFNIDTTDVHFPRIGFVHRPRKADRTIQRYVVRLRRTPQPFGGSRWWFQCPRTGRLAVKLFLPLGGYRFLSRDGYDLGYASQRTDAMGRAQLQAQKVYRRLKGEGNWRDGAPDKPKGMRWRTYHRLSDKLHDYNARFDGNWAVGVSKLLARWGTR